MHNCQQNATACLVLQQSLVGCCYFIQDALNLPSSVLSRTPKARVPDVLETKS